MEQQEIEHKGCTIKLNRQLFIQNYGNQKAVGRFQEVERKSASSNDSTSTKLPFRDER